MVLESVFHNAFYIISVIDVPSSEYLADLENNQLLNDHISEIQSHIGMEFVAHFAPSEIINTPQYQQFMRRTKAKRHLALNDINKYVHSAEMASQTDPKE